MKGRIFQRFINYRHTYGKRQVRVVFWKYQYSKVLGTQESLIDRIASV